MITDLEAQIWKQAYEAQRDLAESAASHDEMAIRFADAVLAEHQANAARKASERRANR